MLALEVQFLTGRCVATQRDERSALEWPPHPTRLFSALAAAYFECDLGRPEHDALTWIERLQPPAIYASEASQRTPVSSFVPVNDSNDAFIRRGKKLTVFAKIDEGIEIRRNRQERYFPTGIPEDPRVVYCWCDASEAEVNSHRPALERLAANVAYLGHSSSLVRVALCETPPPMTHRPVADDEHSEIMLRVPGPMRLEALKDAYDASLAANRRIEPPEGTFKDYVRAERERARPVEGTVFDDRMIVFHRTAGRRLPLTAALVLTDAVRKALISLCEGPVPEVLSGHQADGSRSEKPHVAIVPLANVGHRFSDGAIMGFAVVLPLNLSNPERAEERRKVLRAIVWLTNNPEQDPDERGALRMGTAGTWRVERVQGDPQRKTLQPERYTRASRTWATMTPVVFGHFPKKLDSDEARGMVREHCRMIGLPEPVEVLVMLASPVLGTPPAAHFPSLSTEGKPVQALFERGRHRLPTAAAGKPQPRVRAHVVVEFDAPVRGPVILGAGRYLGMGFCMPVRLCHADTS